MYRPRNRVVGGCPGGYVRFWRALENLKTVGSCAYRDKRETSLARCAVEVEVDVDVAVAFALVGCAYPVPERNFRSKVSEEFGIFQKRKIRQYWTAEAHRSFVVLSLFYSGTYLGT